MCIIILCSIHLSLRGQWDGPRNYGAVIIEDIMSKDEGEARMLEEKCYAFIQCATSDVKQTDIECKYYCWALSSEK